MGGSFLETLVDHVSSGHKHGTAKEVSNQQTVVAPKAMAAPKEYQKTQKQRGPNDVQFHGGKLTSVKRVSKLKIPADVNIRV